MTLDEFGNIIDKVNHTFDLEEKVEIITEELNKCSNEELISYKNHLGEECLKRLPRLTEKYWEE